MTLYDLNFLQSVIYHVTRHVTIWVIEGTCVLLLVRDKGRAWKALELITSTHCIRVLSYR